MIRITAYSCVQRWTREWMPEWLLCLRGVHYWWSEMDSRVVPIGDVPMALLVLIDKGKPEVICPQQPEWGLAFPEPWTTFAGPLGVIVIKQAANRGKGV